MPRSSNLHERISDYSRCPCCVVEQRLGFASCYYNDADERCFAVCSYHKTRWYVSKALLHPAILDVSRHPQFAKCFDEVEPFAATPTTAKRGPETLDQLAQVASSRAGTTETIVSVFAPTGENRPALITRRVEQTEPIGSDRTATTPNRPSRAAQRALDAPNAARRPAGRPRQKMLPAPRSDDRQADRLSADRSTRPRPGRTVDFNSAPPATKCLNRVLIEPDYMVS